MDVMIDIETLATSSDAAILSIGAVLFDRRAQHVDRSTMRLVSIDRSYYEYAAGYRIDPATVQWWAEQGEEAQEALNINKVATLGEALLQVSTWFLEYDFRREHGRPMPRDRVWANPPQFDLTILQNGYRQALGQHKLPWTHKQETCCRTSSWMMCLLHGENVFSAAKRRVDGDHQFIKHRADHDALFQARMVQEVLGAGRES